MSAMTTLAGEPVPKLPLLAKAALISLLIPIQFTLAGLTLDASRVLFVIMVPVLMIQLLIGRFGRLVLTDYMILFFCFWQVLAISIHNPDVALTFAGMQSVTLLGGYLAGRGSIRSARDFQALARFYTAAILVLLPFAAYESLTGHHLIADTINSFLGSGTAKYVNSGARMGLNRATVVMNHAIHWGLLCSIPIGLYFVSLERHVPFAKRAVIAALLLLGVLFSVSSGPLLAAMVQIMLIGYMLAFRKMAGHWKILLFTLLGFYLIGEVLSARPVLFAVASKLAFNPATAGVRMVLFDVGTAQIAKAPWTGVGYNAWDHPVWLSGSVDNYWLLLGITLGLPAMVAVMVAFLGTMFLAGRGELVEGSDAYNARVAITIVLVSLFLTISTVAIWGGILALCMFILGAAGFLLQRGIGQTAADVAETDQENTSRARRRRLPHSRQEQATAGAAPAGADETAPAEDPVTPRYTRFAGRKNGQPPSAIGYGRVKS